MLCAACDREIPNDGLVCPRCNPPRSAAAAATAPAASYHELAQTVRRLKGLVVATVVFGILIAPFAVVIANKALTRFRAQPGFDDASLRQIIILRRLSIGLLLFWAVLFGLRAGAIVQLMSAE